MRRSRSGFTLFEVALALVLLLALSGALLTVTWNVSRLSASTEERSERETAVADLFHRLEAAAIGAHATSFSGGAGWNGDEASLRVSMTGFGDVPRNIAVSYSAERGEVELKDVPVGTGVSADASAALRIAGVSRFRLQYFVGGRWIGAIPEGEAPAAFLVSLWFGSPADADGAARAESPPDRARVFALLGATLGDGE